MQTDETERKTLSKLQTLRDEIRVQLHLGGMEARTKWEELEERIKDFENREAMRSATANDLIHALQKFRDTLRS
jgi:hypothetical protein